MNHRPLYGGDPIAFLLDLSRSCRENHSFGIYVATEIEKLVADLIRAQQADRSTSHSSQLSFAFLEPEQLELPLTREGQ